MSTQEPTLAEVFDAAMRSRMKEMFGGWLPARVESYDASSNKAAVQILILDDYEDEEGERQTERFPIINDIPVGWPTVGGKRVFTSTVAAGDVVVVMFASRPTDKWLSTGGFVDPEDNRHHDINDAFVLPFRLDFGAADASAKLVLTGSDIQAGGTTKVMLSSDAGDFMTALAAAIATLNGSPATNAQAILALTTLQTNLTTNFPTATGHAGVWPVAASKLKGG